MRVVEEGIEGEVWEEEEKVGVVEGVDVEEVDVDELETEIFVRISALELDCCKKWQKIVPDQLLVWGIRAL